MTTAVPPARRAAPLVLVLLAAVVLLFLWRIAELVLVAFIAALLAVYLGGFTDLLCRRLKIPRGPGLALSLVLTFGALAAIGALLGAAVAQQTQDLIAAVPRYLTALDQRLSDLAAAYPLLRRTGIASADTGIITEALTEAAEFVRRGVFAYATATGKVLIDGVAVIVMALYLAWRPALYRDGLLQLVPPRVRPVAREILTDLGASLRAWVGAQLLAMVVLAVLTGIGLWLLSVPYWLAFAIFTGVVVMIPFFGTIVSTLLPALLVLGDRGVLAFLAVASIGVIVHVVEANVVHPLIMQHRVALPPVLTILSVLVMAKLGGLLGMLVAVPALATVVVVARHVLIFQVYGERPPEGVAPHAVLQPSREVPVMSAPAPPAA
jgi:predicted PurR-regulated permease PerM